MALIDIVEVAPRDGLQNLPVTIPPSLRAELCRRALATGVPEVEAVSFVREDRMPTMAGAAAVIELVHGAAPPLTALAINRRGLELAAQAGVRRVRILALASDTFSRRNSNVGAQEGLRQAAELASDAMAIGITPTAIIGAAFGCPFEGVVDPGVVVGMVEQLAAAGVRSVLLADTIGVATPREVRMLMTALSGSGLRLGGHFHNTRNTGYSNALAAVQHGATILDAAAAGLGGCPFAPTASGNIATEDLVYLLEGEGINTGIDLEGAIETARWLGEITGAGVASMLPRAGDRPRAQAAR